MRLDYKLRTSSHLGCVLAWLACAFAAAACSSPSEPAGPASGGSGSLSGGAGRSGGSGSGLSGAAGGGSGPEAGSSGAGASNIAGAAGDAGQGGSLSSGGSAGSQSGGGDSGKGEYGFKYRVPGTKNVDWLCTFNDGAEMGYVYARTLQTGTTQAGLAEVPVYTVEQVQLSVEGAVSDLTGATYDYGGGHHNDSLTFEHGGKTQRYFHSSFGFGFRSCQPMDCRNVYALGTTMLETEGCANARSLPEVCVTIKADGSHDPLTDEFMTCPGDSR